MANSAVLQKATDLDLHCLQRQGISGLSRTRVKKLQILSFKSYMKAPPQKGFMYPRLTHGYLE